MLFKNRTQLETRGGAMIRARLKAGVSRAELAKRSGVSAQAIGTWERDLHDPTVACAELCADALGLSLDEYLGHKVARK